MTAETRQLESLLRGGLGEEQQVLAAFLYGSRARGETLPVSDVDVALVVDRDLPAKERAGLQRRLVVRLERALGGPQVDVRFLDELPTAIRGRAVSEGVLLFERDPVARVRAVTAARMDYHDFLAFERGFEREGLAGLRRRLDGG